MNNSKEVYIVWASDVWFTHANSSIVAVCSCWNRAIDLALEYAESHLDIEPCPPADGNVEDDYDCEEYCLADVRDELVKNNQWSNNNDSLRIECVTLNEIQ